MKRYRLTIEQIIMLLTTCPKVMDLFNWENIDFQIGKCKMQDGIWCFWLLSGHRVEVFIMDKEVRVKVGAYPDGDRPKVAMEAFGYEKRKHYIEELRRIGYGLRN